MRKTIAGVMGPGEHATATDCQIAYELGKSIAEQGWVLLTGGRNEGVMDAANRGAKQANGLTIGILPGAHSCEASLWVDIAIVTGMGSARNNINVLSSDVIFACGMGSGTASEIALALKAEKPVILLNSDEIIRVFFKRFTESHLHVATTPKDAVAIAQGVLSHLESP